MSWSPNDLVTDLDLLVYESQVLTQFAVTDWAEKRGKALEDWLRPILLGRGFDLNRLRTRYEPDAVKPFTGGVYTDELGDSKSETADDLNLATIFTTAATDALYIGSKAPFRGLSVRMLDTVSSVTSTLSVKYWNDAWTDLTVTDKTQNTAGKSFSKGGAVTWRLPTDWVGRSVNSSEPYYYVKLTVTQTPTGATAGQIGVIRRSALCAPVTHRTLMLIMKEAPTGGPGPWEQKAAWHETEADAALQRALQILGGEFDTDESEQVSEEESEQTAAEVSYGTWTMERR